MLGEAAVKRGLLAGPARSTFFKDPDLNVDFQFVGAADFAPYSFRRSAFMEIGGLDEGSSEPGQCGIISDWEVSVLAGPHALPLSVCIGCSMLRGDTVRRRRGLV
jgi:hypothetical protein